MRRLYLKIYLTIIASLLLVVLMAAAIWRFGLENSPAAQAFEMAGELVFAALPPADAPRAVQQQAIDPLAQRLDTDVALFDSALRPIAQAGRPLPPPHERRGPGWVYGRGGPAWSMALPDGRWAVVRAPGRYRPPGPRVLLTLAGIALAVGLCAYPVVRGLTRRLERLQAGVETLGAGQLTTRVKVEGRDEVARLAGSFNRAAERIEELVGMHRMLLANASHELRTPLSRIRMGMELYQSSGDPKYKAQLEQDIAELDGLVDEILLASRLDAAPVMEAEDVDLLALAAEEAARYEECVVEGAAVTTVRGDSRLLRRLIRNLLENATRYGAPPVHVAVRQDGRHAVLEVADAGAGIPEPERERVFTPFHRLGADGRGSGLGLSLVRQIARLHGGEAIVAPHPTAASCFRVTLPVKV
ncbi:MAG: HAMP domain-containing protein [Variibacter sp.]|nr:HAMP domain-containing protein [Variibacter sp.]